MIVKRHMEKPRRSWTVFLMDTSKQIFSAGLLHSYNILCAELLSEGEDIQCQWYFINFSIDIMGIAAFSFMFLKLSKKLMNKHTGMNIEVGEYGLNDI